ncbi:hypothetical protein Q9L42_017530 [Methylomarinum sp. Ch1-1]|uniref:AAA+ ATPase domain-containing protein n=1 Tax=Methylomarinum roseum TaxID=3067653 RepID=A0AAU7NT58_9GAMM|nr:hypothetical protein [Methylomarinum sp. Ch1-1]MDP4519865.1 hypothetical protein [Methylomarinum sp. Ch1-1]
MPIYNSIAPRPRNPAETGLSEEFVRDLLCKHLYFNGVMDLHQLTESIKLSGTLLEQALDFLRKEHKVEVLAPVKGNSERYNLTDKGKVEALSASNKSGYVGPAPVPLEQYNRVVASQSVQNCKITHDQVQAQFKEVTINPRLLDQLGSAMHSGRAIMIYGHAGTGKTYICKQLTKLLGESILIPYAITIGESVIQMFDPVVHFPIKKESTSTSALLHEGHDPRYVECERPVAISGGELTLDMLEIDHNRNTRLSTAPLQLKANNGMYIIDDLGRQRVSPLELFNRWIVPLEEKHDYLSLDTGKRVQFPFDVILIFSSNINPVDLADEAFLRRLGYKIKFSPVSESEYREIWHQYMQELNVACSDDLLARLFARYRQDNKPMLPCHPRDLLGIVKDQCQYVGDENMATAERLDIAWDTYFINLENARVDI